MLNFDTQPRPRNDNELWNTLEFYKRLVTDEKEPPVSPDKAKGKTKEKEVQPKQAYVAHTPGAATGSTAGADSSGATGATREVQPTQAEGPPPKSDLLAGTNSKGVGADKPGASQQPATSQQQGQQTAWPAKDQKKSSWCPCGKRKQSASAVTPVQGQIIDTPSSGQKQKGKGSQGHPAVVGSGGCLCCGPGAKPTQVLAQQTGKGVVNQGGIKMGHG